jgi:hypothetical protein
MKYRVKDSTIFDEYRSEEEAHWPTWKLRYIVNQDNTKCPENCSDPDSLNDCTVYLPEDKCILASIENLRQGTRVPNRVFFDRSYTLIHGEDPSYKKARTSSWNTYLHPYEYSPGESLVERKGQFVFDPRDPSTVSYTGAYYHAGNLQHILAGKVTGGTVLDGPPQHVRPHQRTTTNVDYRIFKKDGSRTYSTAYIPRTTDARKLKNALNVRSPRRSILRNAVDRGVYMVDSDSSSLTSTESLRPTVPVQRSRTALEIIKQRHERPVPKARKKAPAPVLKARKRKATQVLLQGSRDFPNYASRPTLKSENPKPEYSSSSSSSVARRIHYTEVIPRKLPKVKKVEEDSKPAARKQYKK